MRNRVWNPAGGLNLKIFFFISLGIHLLFFFTASILYPDYKVIRLPPLNIEVSFLSLIPDVKIPTKDINKKDPFAVQESQKSQIIIHKEIKPQQNENREEPAYEKELESESPPIEAVAKSVPLEEPKPLPLPKIVEEKVVEEKVVEEKIVEVPMAKVVAIPLSQEAESNENPSPVPFQIKDEPTDKKELEHVKDSSAQVATRIPIEKIEPLPQHRKEEKTVKEPSKTTMAVPPPVETGLEKIEEKKFKEPAIPAINFALPTETRSIPRKEEGISFLKEPSSKGENLSIPFLHSKESIERDHLNINSSEKPEDLGKYSALSGQNIDFAQPRYAENPKPLYPREARKKGYEGEVLLRVEVLSNGRVGQIELKSSSGYDVLDRSAISAVRQWKFIPAKKGENAISFWVNIPIKFQLR